MTPTTLSAGLESLWRSQPATYRPALEASPSGWKLHRLRASDHGDATKALALLQTMETLVLLQTMANFGLHSESRSWPQ